MMSTPNCGAACASKKMEGDRSSRDPAESTERFDRVGGDSIAVPDQVDSWLNAKVLILPYLISLVALFIVASGCISRMINLSYACIFASGALLTASLLHIIPEALEGLDSEFESLHDMGISAGVATLGGISLGVFLHIVFETSQHPHTDINQDMIVNGLLNGKAPTASSAVATSSIAKRDMNIVTVGNEVSSHPDTEVLVQASTISGTPAMPQSSGDDSNVNVTNLKSLMEARKGKALTDVKNLHPGCWNIVIGDFVPNFADGVTIGAAFLGWSSTVGWTVAAFTVIHEVPQELADFMALVNGGMSKMQALVFNFLSAISAILGAVTILALRETLSSTDVSYIILVGAGTFIFIAFGELIPEGFNNRLHAAAATPSIWRTQAFKLMPFLVGALIIGVSLLIDQHCAAGHHAHDH